MFRRYLLETVHISGRDYFGRNAHMKIGPTTETGWYLGYGENDIPLSPHMLEYKWRRVRLKDPKSKTKINVFEHIGVLRAFGLDKIRISSSSWPPYDGCAQTLWNALEPHLMISRHELIWKSIPHEFVGKCANPNRYTEIRPNGKKELNVEPLPLNTNIV